jgi:hypothetical protein
MRDEVSSIWGNSGLPYKIETLCIRCRPYLSHGLGHFLMHVFGRFDLVRSFMVWIYGRKASKPLSTYGPSLIEDEDVTTRLQTFVKMAFPAAWFYAGK